MEQKLKLKLAEYLTEYKKNIHAWITANSSEMVNKQGSIQTNSFLEYMYDYPQMELSKNDFQKRTRTKNNIPNYERCCALRLNGERCTRKKKNKAEFCGTHLKGIPYGSIEEKTSADTIKIEIWLEEINGIYQYIDKETNVYSTEDIVHAVKNPRVIASWGKNGNEYYIINK